MLIVPRPQGWESFPRILHPRPLDGDQRFNFDFNLHPFQSKLADLDARPDWSMIREQFLECRRHDFETRVHIKMIGANRVNVFEVEAWVNGLKSFESILECNSDLLFEVGCDIPFIVPAALTRCANDVSDLYGLGVVVLLSVGLSPRIVEKLGRGHVWNCRGL